MNKLIISIRDTKADYYLPLTLVNNDYEAQRMFADVVNSGQDIPISKHPEDFVLFSLGTVNMLTGIITPCAPRSLGVGIDFIKRAD